MTGVSNKSEGSTASIPVSRTRAGMRFILWQSAAAVLIAISWMIYSSLNYRSTGVSNRLVDLGFASAALPIVSGAIVTAFLALRWLLLTMWPSRLAIDADGSGILFRLGPFGTTHFPATDLKITYPYEMADGDEDGGFEAYLPEEEQLRTLLPRMKFPGRSEPLNRTILRFAHASEREAAQLLRPAIESWRTPVPADSNME